MKPQNENLKLWNKVEKTPSEDWLKEVSTGGRKFYAINPQKQLKQATEMFGPYGSTWGLKNCKRSFIDFDNQTKMLTIECEFFYPEGSFEISNSIKISYMTTPKQYGNKPAKQPYLVVDDEAYKKLDTNTISKALSKLGFSSDVFEGRFEEEGYAKLIQFTEEIDLTQAEIDAAKKAIGQQQETTKLVALWNKQQRWHESPVLIEFYQDELRTLQEIDN